MKLPAVAWELGVRVAAVCGVVEQPMSGRCLASLRGSAIGPCFV